MTNTSVEVWAGEVRCLVIMKTIVCRWWDNIPRDTDLVGARGQDLNHLTSLFAINRGKDNYEA